MVDYAELHTVSNYSFLRGASDPAELVARADALGYQALAITDECSLSGMVRAWVEAKDRKIKLIIGSEFDLGGGIKLLLLATNREGYGNLSHIISRARGQAEKGEYQLGLDDLTPDDVTHCIGIRWCIHCQRKPRANNYNNCLDSSSGSV